MTIRISLTILLTFVFAVPLVSNAAMSEAANALCTPGNYGCFFGSPPPRGQSGPCMLLKPCYDVVQTMPLKVVAGECMAQKKCEGKKFTDQKGNTQGVGDAKGFLDIMKGIVDLLKGGQGGGGSGSQPPPQPQTGTQGCTRYYQVTTPSTDPCAYYVPPTSNSLLNTTGTQNNATSELLNALGGGTGSGLGDVFGEGEEGGSGFGGNVSDLLNGITGDGEGDGSATSTGTSTTAGGGDADYTSVKGRGANVSSGTRGDIEVTGTGATVVAGARDAEANTEIAGFYGGDATGGQPQGIVAKMCRNRPWADSVVTYVIPPSFFDSLCVWRGYQVGVPEPPAPPVLNQQVRQATTSPAAPEVQLPSVPAEVQIWAVPERVPLGTRTSVFWNTRGVESCTVTSPDGSFNESTLSGGASTVPLTGPTTFTISCLTQDDTPVTDYVVVNLTI